jgi:hypothetical protein
MAEIAFWTVVQHFPDRRDGRCDLHTTGLSSQLFCIKESGLGTKVSKYLWIVPMPENVLASEQTAAPCHGWCSGGRASGEEYLK